MTRVVTSATVWNDAVGKRISVSYSEIDEETGKVVSDNKRFDRVITDQPTKAKIEEILGIAQTYVDAIE